mgnify:CR=1 FL=1
MYSELLCILLQPRPYGGTPFLPLAQSPRFYSLNSALTSHDVPPLCAGDGSEEGLAFSIQPQDSPFGSLSSIFGSMDEVLSPEAVSQRGALAAANGELLAGSMVLLPDDVEAAGHKPAVKVCTSSHQHVFVLGALHECVGDFNL